MTLVIQIRFWQADVIFKQKPFSLLCRSSFEGFFASKGAAYALPDGDFARRATKHGGTWIFLVDVTQ